MVRVKVGDIGYYFPTQVGTDDRSFVKVKIVHIEKLDIRAEVLNIYFGDYTHYWRNDSLAVEAAHGHFLEEREVKKELVIKTVFQNAEKYIGAL